MTERRTMAERVVTAAVAGVVALGAAAITQHIWHEVTAGGTATTISADPTSPPPPPPDVWYDL
jgi:hypothetical protein